MLTTREKYKLFCEELDAPFFYSDWWLDIVSESSWDVILEEKDGKVIGALPLFIKKKAAFTGIDMPLLTPFMGVLLKYPNNLKASKKIGFEKKIVQKLITSLPKVSFFNQNFHYQFNNWLPLYWGKYSQSTRYTYLLEDITNLDLVYKSFETKIRGDIKKASTKVEVLSNFNAKILFNSLNQTFKRKNLNTPYSLKLLSEIFRACNTKNCGKMFFARDNEMNIHAAIFIVWDSTSAYYLLGGGSSKFRNSGATSLLLWKAIQFCSSQKIKMFDFEGSMIEPVERFVRAFGGKQKPYFNIKKTFSKRLFLLEQLRFFKKNFYDNFN